LLGRGVPDILSLQRSPARDPNQVPRGRLGDPPDGRAETGTGTGTRESGCAAEGGGPVKYSKPVTGEVVAI
jgi:hypothetical protein